MQFPPLLRVQVQMVTELHNAFPILGTYWYYCTLQYTWRFQKLIHLQLFIDCFVKISPQSSE